VDARSLSQATGVQVGTLNAWIQRDLIPGVTADARGRLREFGIKAATHIAIMAQLTRFGFGAPMASFAADAALADPSKPRCLFASPYQEGPIGEVGQRFGFTAFPFESEATLAEALAKEGAVLPRVYMVVNIERITAEMQRAEKEWQQRRKARPARKAPNG
jgi:hypothetical protein